MEARIYRPAKSAMQSGSARAREWRLEFTPESPREIDRLMGWTGSRDVNQQVSLRFATKAAAVAFAEKEGLAYRVSEPHPRIVRRRPYADNFRHGKDT